MLEKLLVIGRLMLNVLDVQVSRRYTMTKKLFVCMLIIAAVLLAATVAFTANNKSINWYTDMDKALKDAKAANKPLMVDFYADWCGWCKKLDKETYTNTDVVSTASKFVAVKVNTDKNRDLAKKYKVSGLPTIVFMNSKGTEVGRVVGYQPADQFVKSMKTALSKCK
jgi:thiol:disulfide interchange protein